MSETLATRNIGSLEVSVVGLGCNNFGGRIDADRTAAVVATALEEGITYFDTADIYGGTRSEELLGSALGRRRDQVVVATKFGMPIDAERTGAKPDYVRTRWRTACAASGPTTSTCTSCTNPTPRHRLQTPWRHSTSSCAPGRSARSAARTSPRPRSARPKGPCRDGAARFVSVQNEYNLLEREADLDVLPECESSGLAFIPYYPLASGVLTGKYRRGEPPPPGTRLAGMAGTRTDSLLSNGTFQVVENLEAFTTRCGHSLLELAFAWLITRPALASVIAGATTPEQVRANARASNWVLTGPELEEIDKIAPVG